MLISQKLIISQLAATNPGWSIDSPSLDAGFVRVGFETEGYADIEETTGPLVVGKVVNIEELTGFKKPIRFCHVDVGQANGNGEPQEIICGARNFAEGDFVVVSLPGAVLPGGFAIAARKTYDHVSQGMICSAAELGLTAKQTSGIINLGTDCAQAPGTDARELLGLDDTIFDVNVTPDRGYALSARGLTREIASAFDLTFVDPVSAPTEPERQELIDVSVDPGTKAVRFALARVSGIDPQAQSPFWMQRELMAFGARPVNAATDVTNYVMFMLGQPMHAFDAAQVHGAISVRRAAPGEQLTCLDHETRKLDGEDVVVADERGVLSLAGVMGGEDSGVSAQTTDVYFEAATWDPITVARTSRRHKLSSESSRRFERGVDPAAVEQALNMACQLLVDIAGGTIAEQRTVVGGVPTREPIIMPASRVGAIAGVDYSTETVVARLREVGCTVEVGDDDTLTVTAPSWRPDLTMDADLVEEVLRLEGLEDIPLVLPTPVGGRGLSPRQRRRRWVGHALAYSGYAEILPSPFMVNDALDVWGLDDSDPRRELVTVRNPLDTDRATLASTLLPAMLEAVGRNVSRGTRDVCLFGLQQVSFGGSAHSPVPAVTHRPSESEISELLESLPSQPLHVATVGCGQLELAGPWGPGRAYAYADAIESAQVVARALGVELEVSAAEMLPWHPGRCAQLSVDGTVVGHAGELHPRIVAALDLPDRVCAMELDLSAIPVTEPLPAPVLSAFPALHQDIALVVAENVTAREVRDVIVEGAGELLESVELFDIYRSDTLGHGLKSLAFTLLFRAPDRTLTDEEANAARLAAAELAQRRLGAQLRG